MYLKTSALLYGVAVSAPGQEKSASRWVYKSAAFHHSLTRPELQENKPQSSEESLGLGNTSHTTRFSQILTKCRGFVKALKAKEGESEIRDLEANSETARGGLSLHLLRMYQHI